MLAKLIDARRRAWNWFQERAAGPHAFGWLAFFAFIDPIFSPIVPEVYLTALVMARPDRWRSYLAVTMLTSALGAVAGYFVGYALFQSFGQTLISAYGLEEVFARAQTLLGTHVFLTLLLAPFTLIPEKVFVLASGLLHAPFLQFLFGFILGRFMRFGIITYLAYRFGDKALALFDRYFIPVSILIFLWLGFFFYSLF